MLKDIMETNTALAFSKKLNRNVHCEEYDRLTWESLKDSYTVGDLLMTCCQGDAVPKTSINGLQFFAHNAGECSTSPESKWHINSKALISHTARSMGLNCKEEVSGGASPDKWRADVYIEFESRKIAIEIQHSPQTLRHYFKRQAAYEKSGVEAYWVLYEDRFRTLAHAMLRYKFENDPKFKENFFAIGHGYPMIADFPAFSLHHNLEPQIQCTPALKVSPQKWLKALVEKKFIFDNGKWLIEGEPALKPPPFTKVISD